MTNGGHTADRTASALDFEAHRGRLLGVAYRLLGSVAEAEDAVQDAWLRLARTDPGTIDELGAWLTTVTSRLCLDRLRSARVRRETYVGPWLPEPIVQPAGPPGPADLAELDESVRMALLVVLESLTAEQRVAFVLHDVFAVPFAEVASVVGVSEAAARQLALRARRAVRAEGPPRAVPPARQREVLRAFTRAATEGDLEALVAVLAQDVVLRSDGGGRVQAALRPVVGIDKVARFLLGLREGAAGGAVTVHEVLVNGEYGLVVVAVGGRRAQPRDVTVVVPRVEEDGLVHAFEVVRNPEKLTRLPEGIG